MRVFELRSEEVLSSSVSRMLIDLDSIVTLSVNNNKYPPPSITWWVGFASGHGISVTESAFDRVLLAWKSDER